MTWDEFLGRRWSAHRLPPRGDHRSPAETLALLGAVQAQDERAARKALALRSAEGPWQGVVRAHVLRPTWHLVTAADLGWMTALTGPSISRSLGSWFRAAGLSPADVDRSMAVLEATVDAGPADKTAFEAAWTAAGLPIGNPLSSQLLIEAEVRGLLVAQETVAGKPVYGSRRLLPPSPALDPEEALVRLAHLYLRGHGPATDRDFAWWASRTLTDARRGLAACGARKQAGPTGDIEYWDLPENEGPAPRGGFGLPAFDEYVLGYTDRSPIVPPELSSLVITSNGIFRPTRLVDGRVVGVDRD